MIITILFHRWFHNGCCECVGSECQKYGIDDSRCINCPEVDDFDYNEDELDYGDGADPEIDNNQWFLCNVSIKFYTNTCKRMFYTFCLSFIKIFVFEKI